MALVPSMRPGMTLAVATTGLAVCALIVALLIHLPRSRMHASLSLELAEASLALERALGYGGMIHAFKNHVLRPTEDGYRERALEQAAVARQSVLRLGAVADTLGLPLDLEPALSVISAYAAQTERVRGLHARGLAAAELDVAVRIDDNRALESLETALTLVRREMASRQAQTDRTIVVIFLSSGVLVALSLGCVALVLMADRRRRIAMLRLAERTASDLEEMIRIATHDIRAPLRQIGFLVEEVRNACAIGQRVSQAARDDLALIADRTRRLDEMVAKTLGLMRMPDMSAEPEVIDLRKMVADIVALDMPPDATVQISGLTHLRGDPVLLSLALRNLVSNAVKHCDKPDLALSIRAEAVGRQIRLVIGDNGPGIAEEHRERVFGMFETVAADKGSEEVSGVGLATVRKAIRRMGGDVTIGVSSLGGAAFEVSLPR